LPIAWDSGTLAPGATFQFTFTMAGKYTYHCTFHGSIGMVGAIAVPVKAQPTSGPGGTMFRIIEATANPTGTLVFDIQKKDPGGAFQNWKLGLTTKSVVFNLTGLASGTYQLRALLRDTASRKKSNALSRRKRHRHVTPIPLGARVDRMRRLSVPEAGRKPAKKPVPSC